MEEFWRIIVVPGSSNKSTVLIHQSIFLNML